MAALKLAPHPSVHYVDQPPIFKYFSFFLQLPSLFWFANPLFFFFFFL